MILVVLLNYFLPLESPEGMLKLNADFASQTTPGLQKNGTTESQQKNSNNISPMDTKKDDSMNDV